MCRENQLIEYMIQDIVDMFTTDQNIGYDEAMNKFYNSAIFEKLQDKKQDCIWKVRNMYMIFSRMR